MSKKENKANEAATVRAIQDKAMNLAELIKKVRNLRGANRQLALAVESIIPGVLPATMPVSSFTETDTLTNHKELEALLNRQFSDVVMEGFYVAKSKAESVTTWLLEAMSDAPDMEGCVKAIENICTHFQPAALSFTKCLNTLGSDAARLSRVEEIAKRNRLFEIAESVEKEIIELMSTGPMVALAGENAPQRTALVEWHALFFGNSTFVNHLVGITEDAEENILEEDIDECKTSCKGLDAFREVLGMQDTTPKSEVAKAYLFMVERLIEEKTGIVYDFSKHFISQNFQTLSMLSFKEEVLSGYREAAELTAALYRKLDEKYTPNIDDSAEVTSYAVELCDSWSAAETAIRAQLRLYTSIVKTIYEIESLLVSLAKTMNRCLTEIMEFNDEPAYSTSLEIQVFIDGAKPVDTNTI